MDTWVARGHGPLFRWGAAHHVLSYEAVAAWADQQAKAKPFCQLPSNLRLAFIAQHHAYYATAAILFAPRTQYTPMDPRGSVSDLARAVAHLRVDALCIEATHPAAVSLTRCLSPYITVLWAHTGSQSAEPATSSSPLFYLADPILPQSSLDMACAERKVVDEPDISQLQLKGARWHDANGEVSHRVALVMQTSGTTRAPKRVLLTQVNCERAAASIAQTLQLTSQDVGCNALPLYHIHGLVVNLFATLFAGASLVLLPTATMADGPGLLEALRAFEVTWYSAVPLAHRRLLRVLRNSPAHVAPLPRLRLARNCSAHLAPADAAALAQLTGCRMLTTCAMTECMPMCSPSLLSTNPSCDSLGHACAPVVQVGVLAADDRVHNQGTGELCVRGPALNPYEDDNGSVYLPVHSSGWFQTGDLARIDGHGCVKLEGRLKDFINRAGEKLNPRELIVLGATLPRTATGKIQRAHLSRLLNGLSRPTNHRLLRLTTAAGTQALSLQVQEMHLASACTADIPKHLTPEALLVTFCAINLPRDAHLTLEQVGIDSLRLTELLELLHRHCDVEELSPEELYRTDVAVAVFLARWHLRPPAVAPSGSNKQQAVAAKKQLGRLRQQQIHAARESAYDEASCRFRNARAQHASTLFCSQPRSSAHMLALKMLCRG
ncbi:uncharacterized protein MONBRDRAFT_8559 [Monosiga brevicollis MX1]|uniref:AMP-dependent synthetase/ligase domain-containing protein n=1 Tax=Monosiga brevicollis TaxID=81824 RepID=A9V0D9_MONBE|nr:uncharacterized protein MONBRDRAFT_8559 [Monosiga brevicollis MX1]EDQ89139.1 predicted protein [Monosiga brevicollis MX1]|eukprot:XP_001746244.1 hypothetical protein [Monosiga brevicollis MX1]